MRSTAAAAAAGAGTSALTGGSSVLEPDSSSGSSMGSSSMDIMSSSSVAAAPAAVVQEEGGELDPQQVQRTLGPNGLFRVSRGCVTGWSCGALGEPHAAHVGGTQGNVARVESTLVENSLVLALS